MLFKRKATHCLQEWKDQCHGTYAALLEGPRRVGKSTIAEEFAKTRYKSHISIDFSNVTDEVLDVFSSIAKMDEFFLRLQAITNITLYQRESVIIFDEIQLQPKVRQAIKHLVKDGRYDYIETGSLLSIKKNIKGIVIPSEEWKIPVYPMDYEEFLWATGKNSYEILRSIFTTGKPVGQSANRSLMRDFRTYMAVGGMPQAVDAFVQKQDFKAIDAVKRKIIELYEDDFYRIDPSGRIGMLFSSIPAQLSRSSHKYSVGLAVKKQARSKDYELLSELINSRTVLACYNCHDPQISLSQGKELDHFKLYLADTGLFTTLLLKTGVVSDSLLYAKMLSDKLPANLGFLYENAVAQTFASNGRELYYATWPKENTTHSYEVDFLLQNKTKIVPIEIKSSRTEFHESIDVFATKFSHVVVNSCILSQKDLGTDGTRKRYPFYLGSFISEMIHLSPPHNETMAEGEMLGKKTPHHGASSSPDASF